jgi:membrane protein involved in colicin uptake
MIKEAIIGTLIAGASGTAIYLADTRYVRQDTYQQAVTQQRVWQLIDQIQVIRDRAAFEQRELSSYEQTRIRQLEAEKEKLK